jgi:hypothetical protein
LGSLLELLRPEFQLAYCVRDGAVVVSRWGDSEAHEANTIGKVYPLPPPWIGARSLGEHESRRIFGCDVLNSWEPRFQGRQLVLPGVAVVVGPPGGQPDADAVLAEWERRLARVNDCEPILVAPSGPLERSIIHRLMQPTSLSLANIPIREFSRYLQDQYGISTFVDREWFRSRQFDEDRLVSVAIHDEPLWSALEQVRRQTNMAFGVRHDVLWHGGDPEITQVYPVADLIGEGRLFAPRSLVPLVTESVNSAWGPDRLYSKAVDLTGGQLLVVTGSLSVQANVWRLLTLLRDMDRRLSLGATRATGSASADGSGVTRPAGALAEPVAHSVSAWGPVETALRRPAQLTYQQAKLEDMIQHIAGTYGIAMGLDTKAAERAEHRITCDLGERSLGVALQAILRPLRLDVVPAGDRVLVTTEAECRWRVPSEVIEMHDTRALLDQDLGLMDGEELLEFIRQTIRPGHGSDAARYHVVAGQLIATETMNNQRLLSELVDQRERLREAGRQPADLNRDAQRRLLQQVRYGHGIWVRAFAAFQLLRGETSLPPEAIRELIATIRGLNPLCDAPLYNLLWERTRREDQP